MSSNLLDLVQEFDGSLKENPAPSSSIKYVMFLQQIQNRGADMSRWSEDDWSAALRKLGVPEDDIPEVLEDVASWGMVDNFEWATPIEIKAGLK